MNAKKSKIAPTEETAILVQSKPLTLKRTSAQAMTDQKKKNKTQIVTKITQLKLKPRSLSLIKPKMAEGKSNVTKKMEKSKFVNLTNGKVSGPNKQSQNNGNEKTPEKRKSYDSSKIREFIRQQREKRRAEIQSKMSEEKKSPEVIKKRLSNLQRSTSKIVTSNVQRAQRKSIESPRILIQSKESQISNDRKIGILRRIDDNFDSKENRPKPILTKSQQTSANLDLNAPKSDSLKSSIISLDENVPKENGFESTDQIKSDQNFWLRPTPVQIYPYNFIMALRKKLDHITHPRHFSDANHAMVKTNEENERWTKIDSKRSGEATSNRVDDRESENQSTQHETQGQETLSFPSDILSSRNSENQEVYLSHSESDASHHPPPLSTQSVDDLQISSKVVTTDRSVHSTESNQKITSFINFDRGNVYEFVEPLSTHSSEDQKNQNESRSIRKMLNDFSANLSQVIKVNERLHSILSNSTSEQQQTTSATEIQTELATENYSEDFDSLRQTQSQNTNGSERAQEVDAKVSAKTTSASEESIKPMEQSTSTEKAISTEETVKKTSSKSSDANSTHSIRKRFSENVEHLNESFGSDIFNIFKRASLELSTDLNTTNLSEQNRSYSSLGMCNQLIRSETEKSEHLSAVLRLREKVLIDRFKGQISWLELQKQKFKSKGLVLEISAIKKKQRALLLRLEKERHELHRLLKQHKEKAASKPSVNYNIQNLSSDLNIRRRSVSSLHSSSDNRSSQGLKAIELPSGNNIEKILEEREHELNKRRERIDKLMNWHQRLDLEEQKIAEMEQKVMMISIASMKSKPTEYAGNSSLNSIDSATQGNRHVKKIEEGLKTLRSITPRSLSTDHDDVVEINGRHLNKLWKRLTGENLQKFDPTTTHELSKFDLENIYEEAKNVVVQKFTERNELKHLIDASLSQIEYSNESKIIDNKENDKTISEENKLVPPLDLKATTDESDAASSPAKPNELDNGYYFSGDENIEATADESEVGKPELSEKLSDDKTIETMKNDNSKDSVESKAKHIEIKPTVLPSVNSTVLIEDISFPNLDISSIGKDHSLINGETITDLSEIQTEVTPPTVSNSSESKNSQIQSEAKSESETVKNISEPISETSASARPKSTELEQRLIDLDESLKDLNEVISRSPVLEVVDNESDKTISESIALSSSDENKENVSEKTFNSISVSSAANGIAQVAEVVPIKTNVRSPRKSEGIPLADIANKNDSDSSIETFSSPRYASSFVIDYNKMPEAEALRRAVVNKEVKGDSSASHSPHGIPNKPPPPYPAHRLIPMPCVPTTEKIREIVLARVEALSNNEANASLKNATFVASPKSPTNLPDASAMNIYERIILDASDEIWNEIEQQNKQTTCSFHQALSFYRPPNKLKSTQEFIFKRILKLMQNPNHLRFAQRTHQRTYMATNSRRNRDVVDEILIQEMFEKELFWNNFELEEQEIRNSGKDLNELLDETSINDLSQTEEIATESNQTENSEANF